MRPQQLNLGLIIRCRQTYVSEVYATEQSQNITIKEKRYQNTLQNTGTVARIRVLLYNT